MEQYFKFEGSATRSEYWGVNILAGIAGIILLFVGAVFVGTGSTLGIVSGVILAIAAIVALLWISLATTVRRCRNAGINVWWAAAMIIPYIGWIVAIVLGCLKTDEGTK